MTQIKSQRYVALDVLRGMTVAGMILVNNPGSWGHIFPPLAHAAWAGCTPTDLVFPFFLFVVGAAMAFSFAKYNEGLTPDSVKKLVKRGILIFLVGFGLNWFPFYPTSPNPDLSVWENFIYRLEHVRIIGVLQRIAMCYILGGFVALWLQKAKKIIPAMAVLMGLHWLILWLIGDSSAEMVNGAAGAFSLAGQGADHILGCVNGDGDDADALLPVGNAHASQNIRGIIVQNGVDLVHDLAVFHDNADQCNAAFHKNVLLSKKNNHIRKMQSCFWIVFDSKTGKLYLSPQCNILVSETKVVCEAIIA